MRSERKPRVLVAHPRLEPGGGTAVAAHALDALGSKCDVTLVSWDTLDLPAFDAFYGTSIAAHPPSIVQVSKPLRSIVSMLPFRLALLQRIELMRYAKAHAHEFDVVLSTANEFDAGVPCIQYVHFPWMLLPRPAHELSALHRVPGALAAYYGLARRLAHVSEARIARNLTLANSAWTAARFAERYGTPADVLHPPVAAPVDPLPWNEREDVFVCAGRISPEKNIETAIAIVENVRRAGHDVRLDVIGPSDGSPYAARILSLLRERSWSRHLTFHSHSDLLRHLGRSRYGIHAMENEHFGIAVAEMMRSGAIPFVHDSAGPAEIVADERLTWTTATEATEVIRKVLGSAELQSTLHHEAVRRGSDYSVERFRDALVEHIFSFAGGRRG